MPGSGWSHVIINIIMYFFSESLEYLVYLPAVFYRFQNEIFFKKWVFYIFTLIVSTLLYSKLNDATDHIVDDVE